MANMSINIKEIFYSATDTHRWHWQIMSARKVLATSEDSFPNPQSAINGIKEILNSGVDYLSHGLLDNIDIEPCDHKNDKAVDKPKPESKADIHKQRQEIRHGRRNH